MNEKDTTQFVLPTQAEAEEVLRILRNLISSQGSASWGDCMQLCFLGEEITFTDEQKGWTDLQEAGVRAVEGGYALDLPATTGIGW